MVIVKQMEAAMPAYPFADVSNPHSTCTAAYHYWNAKMWFARIKWWRCEFPEDTDHIEWLQRMAMSSLDAGNRAGENEVTFAK